MIKLKYRLTVITLGFIWLLQAQHTTIPDPIFEEFLIEIGLDDIIDGQVLTASISDETFLQINETAPVFPIQDLTGIQDFVSLEVLLIETSNCTSINFGDLTNLKSLGIQLSNDLATIDISGCINLEELILSNNNLNSLNISQNLSLTEFGIAGNTGTLESLDFSQHPNLTFLGVANSNFIELDVRNGTNENITFFTAVGNPDLTCIFVDDAAFSTANWTNIDAATTFVETEAACEALSLNDFVISSFTMHPNPASQFFEIESNQQIKKVEIIDLSGKIIKVYKHTQDKYSITDLSKGLYILNVQTDLGKSSRKLIVK